MDPYWTSGFVGVAVSLCAVFAYETGSTIPVWIAGALIGGLLVLAHRLGW